MIHQAATLQIQKGLLIIVDRDGNIIREIWIHFGNKLIQDYTECLEGIYKNNFTFSLNALEGTREASYYINVTTTKINRRSNTNRSMLTWSLSFTILNIE